VNLETYLKRATRGIWGKRRTDAILELRGNIEARIWALQHQGKTPSQALKIALQEFGDPRAVNSEMARVHTWPGLLRNLLVAGLCSSAIIAGINSGQAQITIIHANNDANAPEAKRSWVNMNSLKANLEAAGIAVNDQPQKPVARFGQQLEKNQPNPTPTLEFRFPGAKKATKIQALVGDAISKDGRFISQEPYRMQDFSDAARDDQVYLQLSSLTSHFHETGLPISIDGWLNPTFQVGQTRLRIGDDQTPMIPYNIYVGLAEQFVASRLGIKFKGFTSPRWWSPTGEYRHGLQVKDAAGSIYVLVTVSPPMADFGVTFDVAVVNESGRLEFLSAWKNLRFGKNKAALEQDLKRVKTLEVKSYLMGSQNSGFGSAKHPANVLLLKLTGSYDPGNLGELIVPAREFSAALSK
jgi:hypothetical protein